MCTVLYQLKIEIIPFPLDLDPKVWKEKAAAVS
jgi:hypothetical protein